MGGIAEMLYSGENRPRLGNAVYGLFGRDFTTRDGVRTMIVVVTPRQWTNLIAALKLGYAVAPVEATRAVSFPMVAVLRFQPRSDDRRVLTECFYSFISFFFPFLLKK